MEPLPRLATSSRSSCCGRPLIAIALASVNRNLMRAAAVLLVVACLPTLLDSSTRPLLDRPDPTSDLAPYFATRPDSDQLPFNAADFVALRDALVATGCTRVGVANAITFEYALWAGLRNAGWEGELRHVDVQNPSGVLEVAGFEPCATVRQRLRGTRRSLPSRVRWSSSSAS